VKDKRGFMDFYIDTGVVFGYGHKGDKFCSYSEKLTKRYPIKNNNYCSNLDILNKELDNLHTRRLQSKTKLVRMVIHKTKIMVDKLNDLSYQSHELYPEVYQGIKKILENNKKDKNPKDYDTIHLTTACIWDYDCKDLDPYFITTDRNDICNNKAEIYASVNNLTNSNCNLKIEYLIDFTNKTGRRLLTSVGR